MLSAMKTDKYSREAESQGTNGSTPSCPSSPTRTTQTETHEEVVEDAEDGSTHGQLAVAAFPQQLWDAIEQETAQDGGTLTADGARVVEWLPAGDSFIIRDKAIFENEVLTKYFNRCKFMSFTRKLYRWGFRQDKSKSSLSTKIYRHKHFLRSNKQGCLKLRSLVNVPPAPAGRHPQAQHPPDHSASHLGQLPPGYAGMLNSQQGYGITMGPNNMMGNDAAVASAHHIFSHPLLQIGSDGMQHNQFSRNNFGMTSNSSIGLGVNPSVMQNSHFSRGIPGITSTSNIGLGERPAPMQNNQFSRGGLGMPSTNMLETISHVDKLEQSRQQLMKMLNDTPHCSPMLPQPFANGYNPLMPPQPSPAATTLNNSYQQPSAAKGSNNNCHPIQPQSSAVVANSYNPRMPPQPPPAATTLNSSYQQPSAAKESNNNYHPIQPQSSAIAPNNNHPNYNHERDMSAVSLACEIMREDPGMEPQRALELAKMFGKK